MTAEGRTQPLPDGPDDPPIDVAAYVRLVWRRRVTVAVATLACVAVALVVHRFYPPTYEARAIIQHGQPVGSAAASDVVARSLALLADPAVYEHLVKHLSLDAPTYSMGAAELKHATTSRVEVPIIGVTILVRVSHADLAAQIAAAVAGRVADVIREQDAARLATATSLLASAQLELAEFREAHQAALIQFDSQAFERRQLELSGVPARLVGEQAFLRAVEKALASNPQPELAKEAALSRGRIASMEATRDFWQQTPAESGGPESEQFSILARHRALVAAVNNDQRVRDQLVDATIQARGLKFGVGPVAPGQLAGASASQVAGRAFLIGLVLSVAGMLLSHFLFSAWRTRTGH
ncbi:MAG: Wzz/FepE/Etk N-terminal domain-containing protein [Acidobacteriota bacterium]|nr:Wzz/FepE/Etk N-terminal domain-containing protein [Acidobacteriota bacterium]